MKCPNCGNELLPGARFCAGCGNQIAASVSQPVNQPVDNPINPPKKSHAKLIGIIVTALVVVLVGVGGYQVFHMIKPDTEKELVYVKDGRLYYTGNMDKEKDPIEVYNGHDDDCSFNAKLSKDMKYLFFICDSDDNDRLYRVNTRKLSGNETKNEKYIEEIDSRVEAYKTVGSGKALYYRETDNSGYDFYYYDGKKPLEIDSRVESNFRSGNIAYYLKSEKSSDEQILCYFDIDKKKSVEIDDCLSVLDYTEDEILYEKGEYGDSDIYIAQTGKKPKKIISGANNVESADIASGTVYYSRTVDEKKTYYDLVEDPYAGADAGISEPDIEDYLTKTSAKSAIDNDYYYEKYREDLYYFYEHYCYSDDNTGMAIYLNYDHDSNSNIYYYIDTNNDIWYLLDSDAYKIAREEYESVSDRIELREELKDTPYEYSVSDLYLYTSKGGEKKAASSVSLISVDAANQVAFYQKSEDIYSGKVCSMDDISYVSDVDDYLYNESNDNIPVYSLINGKECKTDSDMEEAGNFLLSEDGKTLMVSCYNIDSGKSELLAYELKSGEFKKLGSVSRDYDYGYWDGNDFYYYTDDGDFCVYSKGKSKTVLKDVKDVVLEKDGNYMAFNQSADNSDNKLKLFAGKKEILVDRDVNDYSYINETRIVYRKDGDLYVFRGEDKNRRIDRDVRDYWCKADGMEEVW